MIINFFKGLIFPSYIVRFRSMSVFFAIAIFFLSSFILAIPQMQAVSKERYNLVDEQNAYSLEAFNQLSEADLAIIRELDVKIYDGAINEKGNIEEFEFYIFDVENKKIYMTFDLYNVIDPEAEPNLDVYEQYLEIKDENDLLLIFYLDFCLYANGSIIKELSYNVEIDFSSIEHGSDLSHRLIDMFIPDINREISLYAFVATVIYPLVIIILVWLLFKTYGSNLRFKEYYNIGAISSIIPLLLIFIFSWIFPKQNLMQYFSVVFGIYYLFMIIRINSKTKIA